MRDIDVLIIGGGPAGLAAAIALEKAGIRNILVVERERQLGGILRQCIHDGFGLTRFGEMLSGPEYAQRFIDEVVERKVPYLLGAAVTEVTPQRQVTYVSPAGVETVQAKAVVFAMGCRERPRGALAIPGERPSGVFTAGTAQNAINLQNKMVGKEVVILGSGDIGMIMARRLTLEGAHVKGVYEIQPIPSGLPRNIQQCLDDYGIPLHLSHTVTDIHGASRLTGVTVSQVDRNLRPIKGTEEEIPCDTLILSVGLIPENELARKAGITLDRHTRGAVVDQWMQCDKPGFFACGNVLHVHDLVDFVSLEAEKTASAVARFLREGSLPACPVQVTAGAGLNHVLPASISGDEDVTFSMRPSGKLIDGTLKVTQNGRVLYQKRLRKALPAVMIAVTVKRQAFQKEGNVEVSLTC
ncbi:FAD-binding protein [Treponema ruminis]|uniref:NAD(P)/FAD-dependent oxidoreductase n=1 Tax=Treponema ruminis TaxID=744515 RepID=UPI0019816426|nr:FAD-dependent oxidoreductase [Treponema ruminis]QSI03390.1 FAD-binding protein [Treponema ruminis]